MELAFGILIAWSVLVTAVLAIAAASSRADRRTAAQLRQLGLGRSDPGRPASAGALRDAIRLERGDVEAGGYGGLLLQRLVVQTCRMIGVEAAAIFVHDAQRDELALIAGHRVDQEAIGRRAAASGLVREAALTGVRSFVPAFELWPIKDLLPGDCDALVAGISAGDTRAALVAAGPGPFSERDLALLGHIADLGGAGLGDAQLRGGLDAALAGGVQALEAAIERADLRAARTGREVVALATALAGMLGLDAPAMVELQLAARLREVGELAPEYSDALMPMVDEPPLNPAEISARTADVLGRVPGLEVVALIVRHEHERWDGDGQPDGLARDRIPLASRILAVAVAFTQLTGPGRSSDVDALAVIAIAGGSRYDPVVIETLATLALPTVDGGREAPVRRFEWAADDLEPALA
jgi:HD-GYP domain-containing protein (c-di-GMP phosphodiesterase class II)